MFKSILAVGLLVAVSYTNAATKVQKCESMLTASIYNVLVEHNCGFDDNVSEGFKQAYAKNGCPDLVPEKRIYQLANEVERDTTKRISAFGIRKFCEHNLEGYADLNDAFNQGVDMFNQNMFKQAASKK